MSNGSCSLKGNITFSQSVLTGSVTCAAGAVATVLRVVQERKCRSPQTMADDSQTCCTVETPSRLMLFYPDSTPCALTTLLPTQPVSKPVGQHVTLGRSGSADIRLNDERMSRLYASLWHDGKDPFVFRVSNLSERKMLMVDGVMLRHKEEAEVKDGTVLTLDFLQLKAKVCAGDYVAFSYQVIFIKNVVMSPPPMPSAAQPPDGKCFMPPRRDSMSGKCLSSVFSCSDIRYSTSLDKAATGDVVSKLLGCLHPASLESGVVPNMSVRPRAPPLDTTNRQGRSLDLEVGAGTSYPPDTSGYFSRERRYSDDVGVEYELPENLAAMGVGSSSEAGPPSGLSAVSMSPSVYTMGNRLSLNIPPHQLQASGSWTQLKASTASASPHPHSNLSRLCSASHASSPAPQQHSLAGNPRVVSTCTTSQHPYRLSSLSPPVHNQLSGGAGTGTAKTDFSCWFNMETTQTQKPQNQKEESIPPPDLPDIAQRVQDALVDSKKHQVCAACNCRDGGNRGGGGSGGGGDSGANINMAAFVKPVPDVTQKMALEDMVLCEGEGRKSPVENSEWDTDDPNINCYMK